MPTRRTLLGQAVALATGGVFATTAVSGRSSDSQQATSTTVSFTLDTTILGTTGVPATVAPRVATLMQRYDSLSLGDVDSLSGRAQFGGAQVTAGHALARGSFDAGGLGTELRENEPRFTATTSGSQSRSDTGAHTHPQESTAGSEEITRFVDSGAGETVELSTGHVGVARGNSGVASLQSQQAGLSPTGQSATDSLAELLGGNAVVIGTIAAPAKRYLHRRLSHLSESSQTVLDAVRGGGISIRVGQSETTVRYALAVAETATESDFDTVIDEFASDSSVSITDTTVEQSHWIVDGTVPTTSLWESHERFLGLQ